MSFNELKKEVCEDWKDEFDVTLNDEYIEESDDGCYVRYIDYDISRIVVYMHCSLIDGVRIENDGRSEYLVVTGDYKYSNYDIFDTE